MIEKVETRLRPFQVYGVELPSRLFLGTSQYPSPQVLADAVKASGTGVITVSLRREQARGKTGERFMELIQQMGARVLPNTAGCRTPKEAITTAQMARELFDTSWIKLEVIANDDTLQPDLFGLVEAANVLARDGFNVFPYTTEDLGATLTLQCPNEGPGWFGLFAALDEAQQDPTVIATLDGLPMHLTGTVTDQAEDVGEAEVELVIAVEE